MSFLETPRFPDNVSFESRGGPLYAVSIVQVNSGYEQRNLEQDEPLHRFDVSYGIKSEANLYSLLEFFHAVQGPTHEFRYKDWNDFQSIARNRGGTVTNADQDCQPAAGDGANKVFQLIKTYTKGVLSTVRTITKPVSGTVLVSVNGAAQTDGVDYTLDTTTGIITFTVAPPNTHTVKAGYEFDTPCRFETERIEESWIAHEAGESAIVVMEVRI